MRATGIVRRIDDLGRVVIPKEIRRIMKIKENDPLEMYLDTKSNGLVLTPYRPEVSDENNATVENLNTTRASSECDCSCAVKTKSEKKIVYLSDSYNETTRAVQITDEQNKLLNWLNKQGYLSSDISIHDNYPELEDLT